MRRIMFYVFSLLLLFTLPNSTMGDETCTPLVMAANNCDYTSLKILLDSGINPNCRSDIQIGGTSSGVSAPWMIIQKRCEESFKMMELFISKGYNVNFQNLINKELSATALHMAAYEGNVKVAELLVNHGADSSIKTRNGRTPLDFAVENKHSPVVAVITSQKTFAPTRKTSIQLEVDTIILKNGDTLSGNIVTTEFPIRASYGEFTFKKGDINIIEFEEGGKNIDTLLLINGDKLSGVVTLDLIKIELRKDQIASIGKDKIKKIQLQK
jgi:hypothetical protein